MRLWSIHPCYLDTKGLVALWREGLLAQNVLLGNTRGYRNHPQLTRFRGTDNPVGAIASYLRPVANEADKRGYNFNRSKITDEVFNDKIPVTSGQIEYEFRHLLGKLEKRNPALYEQLRMVKEIELHPLLLRIKGNVEDWEIVYI
jgi:Pyrimidine dimer DNA glycosylase